MPNRRSPREASRRDELVAAERRTRAGWSEITGSEAAELIAETVGDILDRDAARQQNDANAYRAKLAHFNTLAREAEAVVAREAPA